MLRDALNVLGHVIVMFDGSRAEETHATHELAKSGESLNISVRLSIILVHYFQTLGEQE